MSTDPQSALIYTMVLCSAADGNMSDEELGMLGDLVRHLPVFRGFDADRIGEVARECSTILQDEDGLDNALTAINDSLPDRLRETAYVVACDVVAADGHASQEELRMLEILRHRLDIDRLNAAAIERAARGRYMTLY